MQVTTVGIDLAKNVFQIHGVDECGKTVLRKTLKRSHVAAFFANLPPCLIGMEACASAHHWARQLGVLGHRVRLIAPQFVKPYVKSNKNDAADAEAICEAVSRQSMRFVPVKTVEQQSALALHRARQAFVKARTAQANKIRGLLGEYGVIVPQGIAYVTQRVPQLIDDATNELPGVFVQLIARLLEHLRELNRQVEEIEQQIRAWHRSSDLSRRLEKVPGIGVLTASALAATVGNARAFTNGRQMAAWLGLVPRQHSSGGKQKLLGMSKRGDAYLRTLLIHGAVGRAWSCAGFTTRWRDCVAAVGRRRRRRGSAHPVDRDRCGSRAFRCGNRFERMSGGIPPGSGGSRWRCDCA